ncbi:FKBP-type peptidyl-prolyl cis-trans isomerase [Streptomyces sp. NPDC060194]|uniref:FKBP-type peptidyl-prolyl cis-trans isomerase n=1 Tax=Streptomyces sp. NPDC060194 TaxID=3347069 RepID=UPI0036679BA7
MRRRSLLLAVPAGLLTLAGCGDDKADKGDKSSSSVSPSATNGGEVKIVDGPLPEITKGEKFGQKPTVAKGSGEPSKDLAVKTLITGSGGKVAQGSLLQADYLGQIWASGKVFDNSYDRGQTAAFPIGVGKVIPGWDKALVGKNIGDRVEMAIPPALGYGEQGNPQAGIEGTDTLVFVVDIVDSWGPTSSAKGKDVAPKGGDVPKVGTNTDGKAPSIEVPKAAAPKKLVSEYVIQGDGATVKESDSVIVQYKGVLWDGGKEFDSSYKGGAPISFPLNGVIPGWTKGLAGKKVGSRVVLVVPPDQGYGDQAQGEIPANATLVFSVDLLAVL